MICFFRHRFDCVSLLNNTPLRLSCHVFLISAVKFVRTEMKAYRLYTVVPRLVEFIEQLTNCYVRLNRTRLKGAEGEDSARAGENKMFLACWCLSFMLCITAVQWEPVVFCQYREEPFRCR